MSVSDVTARIAQIQAQLGLLPRPASAVPAAGGTQFATALTDVSGAAGVTGMTGPGGRSGGTGDLGQQVVAEARKAIGLPYVWGGTDLSRGVDCSGLIQSVYAKLGVDLPRVSADQARAGRPVASMAEARPGDLIAWDNSSRNDGADHIAIYVGDGKMIEAPRPGAQVQLVPVTTPPDYIRRVLPDAPVGGPGAAARVGGGAAASGVPYADLFNRAGRAHGVDPTLLAAVARQESGFDPGARSPAGAQGLMQLMPATAQGLGVADPFDPAQAVDGAAKLLHDLIGRFGQVDLALAAYNAGPGAVLRYDGVPPYPETQNYVRSVMAQWRAA